MKQFLVTIFLLAGVVGFAQTKQEQEVIDVVQAFHKAVFVDKDSLTLEKLSAPEVTYGHSGGKLEERKGMIDAASHNQSTYTGITASNISVSVNGKTAVSRYLLVGTETNAKGKVTELRLNILQVWVKEKKGWKMMARQAVKVAEPK